MKNLTAQQKLRVQKEFTHFKDTHGALPTKLSDFKAGSFSNAERPYASWLIKQLKKKRKNPNHDEREKSIIMTEVISFINHNFCSFLQDFYKISYEDNIGYLFSNLDVVVGSSYNPQGITSEDQQEYGNLEKYYPEFYKEGVEQRKKYFIAMRNVVMYYKDMMKKILRVRRGYGFTPYIATKKFDIKDVIHFHNTTMSGVRVLADDLIMGKWET